MGYRLELSEINYKSCGGKLYGYIDDDELKELKSYKWLLDKKYITGEEYWNYGCNPQIILSSNEFKEFIELYNEDFNNIRGVKDTIINQEDMQELIKSNNDKLIEWY